MVFTETGLKDMKARWIGGPAGRLAAEVEESGLVTCASNTVVRADGSTGRVAGSLWRPRSRFSTFH